VSLFSLFVSLTFVITSFGMFHPLPKILQALVITNKQMENIIECV